jgi:peptidoglycan/xylan/chitin deacetylase (PgdA/CDA1 family)
MSYPWEPVRRYYARNSARFMFRRPISIRVGQPLISFTFDDFPRTALLTGGEILKRHGVSGTYYTALGLLGEDSPSGPLFIADDLRRALGDGHELGCHTFSHDDAWHTDSKAFEGSIVQNQKALEEIAPWATANGEKGGWQAFSVLSRRWAKDQYGHCGSQPALSLFSRKG